MSRTVKIESPSQFSSLIQSSSIVVTDFWADWCGPCKTIAPLYEQLSTQLSRPNRITFSKVNTDEQKQITQSYGITAMPTFLIFKNGREVSRIQGANPQKLSEAVKKLANEAAAAGSSSSGGFGESSSGSGGAIWRGLDVPKGYTDVTGEVDLGNLELLNADSELGSVRTLLDNKAPSALDQKGKAKSSDGKADWVESDTDEQFMLYMPFQSTLKIHSLQFTSLPSSSSEDDHNPMRPKTINFYPNRSHILGFEEADDTQPTQTITLNSSDWDSKTGTAKVELRFVKFQKVTSLVVFVADGDGDGEKVRLDRVRIMGETGEKRVMGKLEKIGDEAGE